MSLKERIQEISEYFKGIDYYNDALIVKASFPEKLTVVGNDELGIKVVKSDDGLWYYYGDKNQVEIEDMLDLIQATVNVYEEARKKANLFRAKCEELKEMFAISTLEKLETLTFTFDDTKNNKVKPKRKYTKRKKDVTNNITITEEENKNVAE